MENDQSPGSRRTWTAEEDQLLSQWQAHYGNKWSLIANHIPGRTGQQICQRWRHKVNPNIVHAPWTDEEDALLMSLVETIGQHWAAIARQLPGRTDQQCLGRWRRALDPAISRGEWSQQEDGLLLAGYSEVGSQWAVIAKNISGRSAQQCRGRFFSIKNKAYGPPGKPRLLFSDKPPASIALRPSPSVQASLLRGMPDSLHMSQALVAQDGISGDDVNAGQEQHPEKPPQPAPPAASSMHSGNPQGMAITGNKPAQVPPPKGKVAMLRALIARIPQPEPGTTAPAENEDAAADPEDEHIEMEHQVMLPDPEDLPDCENQAHMVMPGLSWDIKAMADAREMEAAAVLLCASRQQSMKVALEQQVVEVQQAKRQQRGQEHVVWCPEVQQRMIHQDVAQQQQQQQSTEQYRPGPALIRSGSKWIAAALTEPATEEQRTEFPPTMVHTADGGSMQPPSPMHHLVSQHNGSMHRSAGQTQLAQTKMVHARQSHMNQTWIPTGAMMAVQPQFWSRAQSSDGTLIAVPAKQRAFFAHPGQGMATSKGVSNDFAQDMRVMDMSRSNGSNQMRQMMMPMMHPGMWPVPGTCVVWVSPPPISTKMRAPGAGSESGGKYGKGAAAADRDAQN